MNRLYSYRFLFAVVMATFLVGPAPGEVGSCSEEFETASAFEFCIEQGAWSCARQEARGEIDEAGEQACRAEVENVECPRIQWPPGCTPTTRQTQACIDALSSQDRLAEDEADLIECSVTMTLCPDSFSNGGSTDGGQDISESDAGPDASDAGSDASAADAGPAEEPS